MTDRSEQSLWKTELLEVAETYEGTLLSSWLEQWSDFEAPGGHGDWPRWVSLLESLPEFSATQVNLDQAVVEIKGHLDTASNWELEQKLRAFHPWRKGPYCISDVHIDTEWRSDLKWERLKNAIMPLRGRTILDVGCGNGYHLWRMLGEGAQRVVGVDPMVLSFAQFLAVKHFAGLHPCHILPLGFDEFPKNLLSFDTVFSMGVLYHRKSPIDHLVDLKACLKPGGQLVLETLVIEQGDLLVPRDRYAQMRNVWFIPSCRQLEIWLKRCGFRELELVSVSKTTKKEQRATSWMQFQSLQDFLDPLDQEKTVEGYPAPKRAIFVAQNS